MLKNLPLFVVLTLLFTGITSHADTLGDKLTEAGFDHIIGTWVDEDTNGTQASVTYAWRYTDHVIEITSRDTEKETVALMAVNQGDDSVVHTHADNTGGIGKGSWSKEDDEAVLTLDYVTGDGDEGTLVIRHRFENEDTMVVTLDLDNPIEVRLIRVK